MTDQRPNLDSLFLAALDIESDDQRAAFLAASCGQDQQLRRELELLLQSHQRAGSFLERPAPELDDTKEPLSPQLQRAAALQAGLSLAFSAEQSIVVGNARHSVLKSLGAGIDLPRVALRDVSPDSGEPIVRSRSLEMPNRDSDSRYQLQGEIARGGMGAILKGRDIDLGRDLAIKVLLDKHRDKPEIIQRFVEEAQIGGQLQHPGIAPVYELGQFSDKRPYFAMKLVKGETLAKLLLNRGEASEERGKFIGIFEQICQAMAYAHSRGVIHRDLKPANIMVGAFGEVQVMDWGLAKVLPSGGVADEKKSLDTQQGRSIIQTLRSLGSDAPGTFGSIGSQTQIGSVMGTPAYMPPEQALGEIDNMDERADVFGLGAILCEILTGKPPYVGEDNTQVFRLASRGKLDACFARLQECGAEEELVRLTKKCLELDPQDRPRDASAVAERVSTYLESVETKLREAELAGVDAKVRAEELGRRQKLTLAAGGVVVATLLLGMGLSFWQSMRAQRAETVSRKNEVQATKNAAIANEERRVAKEQRARAELERDNANRAKTELRRNLYAASMSLIPVAWKADHVGRATEHLDQQVPAANEEDLRGFEWHFWDRQCRSESRELVLGHVGFPFNFSGDGRRGVFLKSATPNDIASQKTTTIEILDVPSGKVVGSLPKPTGVGIRLQLNHRGNRLAMVSFGDRENEAIVEVWDIAENRRLLSTTSHFPQGYERRVAVSPDGRLLAIIEGGRAAFSGLSHAPFKAKIWNLEQPTQAPSTLTVESDKDEVGDMIFASGNNKLAIAFLNRNLPSSSALARPSEKPASAIHLLDLPTGKEMKPIEVNGKFISLEFNGPGDRLIAVGSDPLEIHLWDISEGEVAKELRKTPIDGNSASIHFVKARLYSDDRLLAVASPQSPNSWLIDSVTGEIQGIVKSPGGVRDLEFDATRNRLVVLSNRDTAATPVTVLKEWEMVAEGRHSKLGPSIDLSTSALFPGDSSDEFTIRSPAGNRVAHYRPGLGQVRICDSEGKELCAIAVPSASWNRREGFGGAAQGWRARTQVTFSPNGQYIFLWDQMNRQSKICETNTGKVRWGDTVTEGLGVLPGLPRCVLTPNLRYLAIHEPDCVKVFSFDGFNEQCLIPTQGVTAHLSPDGGKLVTVARRIRSTDKTTIEKMTLWDARTGKAIHSEPIGPFRVTFSSNSRVFASMESARSPLAVWNAETGVKISSSRVGPNTSGIVLNSNGTSLVSWVPISITDVQSLPTVWDTAQGKIRYRLEGLSGSVESVVFSPDDRRIATLSYVLEDSSEVKLWHAETGRELLSLYVKGDPGLELSFSADGHRLMLGTGLGRELIWDATPRAVSK